MRIALTAGVLSLLSLAPLRAQAVRELSTGGIRFGNITYYENCKDVSQLASRLDYFKGSVIRLRNLTTDLTLDASITVDTSRTDNVVFVQFHDPSIANMQSCQFSMYVNDTLFASSDSTGETGSAAPLQIDIKPSLDLTQPQELDVNWNRNIAAVSLGSFAGNALLDARGKFSTKPDSAALNSVQWSVGYRLIWGNGGPFKYIALSGQAGGQHPQDFSRTDLVGSLVLSSILPCTDILARAVTGNRTDASVGLLIQPAVELVERMTQRDSSYVRGAFHASWEVPLFAKEYAQLYSVAYFQKAYRPRSYIEITFVHNLSPTFSLIAKWTNGELPPLFTRVVDLRIGLRME